MIIDWWPRGSQRMLSAFLLDNSSASLGAMTQSDSRVMRPVGWWKRWCFFSKSCINWATYRLGCRLSHELHKLKKNIQKVLQDFCYQGSYAPLLCLQGLLWIPRKSDAGLTSTNSWGFNIPDLSTKRSKIRVIYLFLTSQPPGSFDNKNPNQNNNSKGLLFQHGNLRPSDLVLFCLHKACQ